MRLRCAALLLWALTACSDGTGPTDAATALALNRAKWFGAGISDYQFTIERGCDCVPESVGPVVIEVRANAVQNRRYLSGIPVDPQFEDLFTAVPGLFDIIEQAIRQPAVGLAVRYNPEFGYPESIQIDWLAGVVDDEVSYSVTDFTVLSAP
jgi:Family of unknown function (DUF6174)